MIRTKYKVLVPLVEYYEKEDAKKLEEEEEKKNAEDELLDEIPKEEITLDTIKRWMLDSLMSYKEPDFIELRKRYARKNIFFRYDYRYALHKACLKKDMNVMKALVLGLDDIIYQEIYSNKKHDVDLVYQKYKKYNDVLESMILNGGDENVEIFKFIMFFATIIPIVAISFNKSIINHDIIRTLKKKGCKTSKELQSLPES